jgi:hypothetical protein
LLLHHGSRHPTGNISVIEGRSFENRIFPMSTIRKPQYRDFVDCLTAQKKRYFFDIVRQILRFWIGLLAVEISPQIRGSQRPGQALELNPWKIEHFNVFPRIAEL